LVERHHNTALKTLGILDRELALRPFIAGDAYTIADMSVYAYTHRADEAALPLEQYRHVGTWIARVQAQPGFLPTCHPYSIDPFSSSELP
jgi:glutathione S-transferase